MREVKAEANNIQDAVEKGLSEIGMRRDQVEVVVVSEGTRGFLGIGAKKACVILREKKWTGSDRSSGSGEGRRRPSSFSSREPRRSGGARGGGRFERGESRSRQQEPSTQYQPVRPPAADLVFKEESLPESVTSVKYSEDPVEHAKELLTKTLELVGMPATISEASYDQAEALVSVRFETAQPQFFTAENGRTLQALQFLTNSILNKNRQQRLALRIDTGDYWKNKESEMSRRVEEAVSAVKTSSQPYRMEPMPAPMRKLVHNLVKTSYPEMETASEGEGQWRKVVIRAAAAKQEASQ
jgi:spoIIIJ-associated protein